MAKRFKTIKQLVEKGQPGDTCIYFVGCDGLPEHHAAGRLANKHGYDGEDLFLAQRRASDGRFEYMATRITEATAKKLKIGRFAYGLGA